MTKVTQHPNNSRILQVGDNIRIEPGPKLVKAVATEELLHNNRTAAHYQVGERDARGRPIELGKEMSYLEWGADDTPINEVFYVYEKVAVNSTDEFIDDEPNPHFVAPHIREAAANGERGEDLIAYDYKWIEIGIKATEEKAIEFAQSRA